MTGRPQMKHFIIFYYCVKFIGEIHEVFNLWPASHLPTKNKIRWVILKTTSLVGDYSPFFRW